VLSAGVHSPLAKPKHRPSDRQTDRQAGKQVGKQANAQRHGVDIPGYVMPIYRGEIRVVFWHTCPKAIGTSAFD